MSDNLRGNSNFDEYIRLGEPSQQERAETWRVAIGLQAVDGLKVSNYLLDTAQRNIEGDITIDEARELVSQYYITKVAHDAGDEDKEEGDRVSANITKILSSASLDFSTKGYIALHRRIFEGVMKHAGELRKFDITKKEWVLEGDTVNYLNWEDLHRALDYDIEQERHFSYRNIERDELVAHITKFVSGLWQIHPFAEGNTRTTAVFVIQYLRSIGFTVDNDLFAHHSWYFRNALVRANYKNAHKGIDYSPVYLERFFSNLLFAEKWDLRNRYLHIHPSKEWRVQPNLTQPSNTPQAPHKYPTSHKKVGENVLRLIKIIGDQQLSLKELLSALELKDRKNFLERFLYPAINEGYIRALYSDKPRHPRQKYVLTKLGMTILNDNDNLNGEK